MNQLIFNIEANPIIYLSVAVVITATYVFFLWRIFSKANSRGWFALIPIFNIIKLIQISGRPAWWLFLLFIPLINLVAIFIILLDLSKNFGKHPAFVILLILLHPLAMCILALDGSEFDG